MPTPVLYFMLLIYVIFLFVDGWGCCKHNSHFFKCCHEWHNMLDSEYPINYTDLSYLFMTTK